MGVTPVPPHGRWALDARGDGRAVRVSAHAEAGFLVLSTWKAEVCVGTVRLLPGEAAELVAGITDGLAHLATAGTIVGTAVAGPELSMSDLEQQLDELRRRMAHLESRFH
jgi:hypothetical protein